MLSLKCVVGLSPQVNISQMSTTPQAKGKDHKASTPSTGEGLSFFGDVSAIAPVRESCLC